MSVAAIATDSATASRIKCSLTGGRGYRSASGVSSLRRALTVTRGTLAV